MTTQTYDLEIELDQNRVLTGQVEIDWCYQSNPGDKERNHYSGEDDGYYREDETVSELAITYYDKNGNALKTQIGLTEKDLSKEDYKALERAVENIGYDD